MHRVAVALLLWSTPALAMNWEGKEDWMADVPHALAYEQQFPALTPPPLPVCDSTGSANPYEQVPIPGKNCRPAGADNTPKH